MRALAHVAKEVKFHFPVNYVSLLVENKNNSITCKFAYILEVFFPVIYKMQNKNARLSTSKDKIREKQTKQEQKKQKN